MLSTKNNVSDASVLKTRIAAGKLASQNRGSRHAAKISNRIDEVHEAGKNDSAQDYSPRSSPLERVCKGGRFEDVTGAGKNDSAYEGLASPRASGNYLESSSEAAKARAFNNKLAYTAARLCNEIAAMEESYAKDAWSVRLGIGVTGCIDLAKQGALDKVALVIGRRKASLNAVREQMAGNPAPALEDELNMAQEALVLCNLQNDCKPVTDPTYPGIVSRVSKARASVAQAIEANESK